MSPLSDGWPKHNRISINLINGTSARVERHSRNPVNYHTSHVPSFGYLSTNFSKSSLPEPHVGSKWDSVEDNTIPPYAENAINSTVPLPVFDQVGFKAINQTVRSVNQTSWWQVLTSTHPDVLLAFALIVFYAIFVLFICIIVIRIVVTIMLTGSSFNFATSSDGYSNEYEPETSSRTRGISHTGTGRSRRFFHEMTSFAIDRTNSPSIIDQDEDEAS